MTLPNTSYWIRKLKEGAYIRKRTTYRLITAGNQRGVQIPDTIFERIKHLLVENNKYTAHGITTFTITKDLENQEGRQGGQGISGRV